MEGDAQGAYVSTSDGANANSMQGDAKAVAATGDGSAASLEGHAMGLDLGDGNAVSQTGNVNQAYADGTGNAVTNNGAATANNQDLDSSAGVIGSGNATRFSADDVEDSAISTGSGDAKLDRSTNIKVGDINVAIQRAELEAEVSGAPLSKDLESSSYASGSGRIGESEEGKSSSEGSSRSNSSLKFSVRTGDNVIKNVDNQIGISAIAQNTGLNSAVQNQVNVNASVGTINR
jgi:hypothetical protein